MPTRSSPRDPASNPPQRLTFSDGTTADLVVRDGTWAIEIDGVVQSHLGDPAEPPKLSSIRWMLAALGDKAPRTCAHLGGGLMTLPRAISHRWPTTEQVVVEVEPSLIELATGRFPVPERVVLEQAEARSWLEGQPPGRLDAVVIDIFSGNRIPPAFSSLECMTAARHALTEDGRLVLNSVAGPDLLFTRRELATLRSLFPSVAMIVQGSALHGVRFGNATLIASASPIDPGPIRAALAGDPSKGALVTQLDPIVRDAEPLRESEQIWSPHPTLPDLGPALRAAEQAHAIAGMVGRLRAARNPPKDRDP